MRLAQKCKKRNIKVIITAHTVVEDFKDSFKFTYNKRVQELFRKWIKSFYSNADMLIAPTSYVKQLLQSDSYNISVPITVISNGVDIDLFSKSQQDNIECRQEIINYINNKNKGKQKIYIKDKLIISVGLYLERKGILNFIKLAQALPDYKFIWFGHTSGVLIPHKIRNIIKKGKKLSNVYFPGYVEHSLLSKAYKAGDLFLMLSYEETEGLVVLEALASKIQVIINDIAVYGDWLQDQVHCYKVHIKKGTDIIKDTNLLQLISDLLNHTLPETVEAGYIIAEKRDLVKIGERLLEVYKTSH